MDLQRDTTGHTGHTGQEVKGGILARLRERFTSPIAPCVVAAEGVIPKCKDQPNTNEADELVAPLWDEVRANAVIAAVEGRVEQAMFEIPAKHPHRQARLNVLANERGIIARLLAKRDSILWGWLDSLECLLARWEEEDAAEQRQHHREGNTTIE